MLNELFGRSEYYDFPSFEVALYSLLLAFVLSTVIGLTYRLTYRGDRFPNHFFQAIILSSMASCMVIMAVGDNLAAGFGVIGAIAIIRFRTRIQDPRNIIFIFASLSIGIATGVYGYAIALAGTLIFCLVAILLYFSKYSNGTHPYYDISFTIEKEGEINLFLDYVNRNGFKSKSLQFRKLDPEAGFRYTFRILIGDSDPHGVFRELSELSGYSQLRVSPSDELQL